MSRTRALAALAVPLTALSACGSDVTQSSTSPTAGSGGSTGSDTTSVGGNGQGGAGGEVSPLRPAKGGLRRLLPQHVLHSVGVVLGPEAQAAIDHVPDVASLSGFASIGAAEIALSPTDVSEFETLALVASTVAVVERARVVELAPCAGEDAPAVSCYDEVARAVGRVAWRRPLFDEERARLAAVGEQGRQWAVDQALPDAWGRGLQYELMALLQSPNFLYQVEVGEPDPEDPSRRRLDAYELVSRISFFLLGQTPTPALLDAAEAGNLDTAEGVRSLAAGLLQRQEARGAVDAFFVELLSLDGLSNLSKDPELFPAFSTQLATSMRGETLAFLRDLVWDRRGDAREMFVSQDTFVDADLAALYGVDAPEGEGFSRVTLPDGQERSGLLGQASFLAKFAHPGQTSPTRRGAFVSSRFLCEDIPPPPPGVAPSLPEETEGPQTMREKLQAHQEDPSCAGCHVYMDPMGLSLEHFDAIGAWRESDRGLPIDTAGDLEGLGSFAGPRDLGQLLHDDDRVPRCMVQNFVRSSLGHMETSGELYEVRRIADGFVEGGHDLQDLMVELCASPLFRYVGEPK